MDNRSLLLQRAMELFAARGYDAVGVQEIADAAGVTKPTLYHYFGSKQGLLQAVVDAYHRPLLEEVRAAAQYQGDLPRTLEEVARSFFRFALAQPVYYRMLLGMIYAPRDSEAHQAASRSGAALQEVLEGLFAAAAQDHGNMRGRQRFNAAALTGLLHTCITLWLNGSLELDDDLARRAVHQFQHGIYS